VELFDAIARRYSYRGTFTDQPVPRDHLRKIVQAGIQAPSGCNGQVASFVIVDDPEQLLAIAAILQKPVCDTARAMIVCLTDPRSVIGQMSFAVEDCAASVENMLLAITALGYATVWLDGALRVENRSARIGQILGVPPGKTIRIVLPLGVPTEPGQQRERLPFDQRAWFNRYGRGEGAVNNSGR
jgi:nitroreductase